MEHDLLAQKRTAYALGELDATERAVLEVDMRKSEARRLEVEEIRALAAALSGALANEQTTGMSEIQHLAIESTLQQMTDDHEATARMRLRRQRIAFWVPTVLAACALLASGVTLVMLSRQAAPIQSPTLPDEKIVYTGTPGTGITSKPRVNHLIIEYMDVASINPPIGAPVVFGPHVDNVIVDRDSAAAFHPVGLTPLSSFPLTFDTSTVPFIQRFIQIGAVPLREMIHIEAMINSFPYEDAKDLKPAPLAVKTEVSECPWNPAHRLARVLVKAQDGEKGAIVAEDVSVRVEFNPHAVTSYRLIGYENRPPTAGVKQGDDVANVNAGFTLTALYEIVPTGSPEKPDLAGGKLKYQQTARLTATAIENENELFTVVLHFRTKDILEEQSVQAPAINTGSTLATASADFRFAAAVAHFGLLLLDPPATDGQASLAAVQALAQAAIGSDATGDRKRFLQLLDGAKLVVN